MQMTLIVAVHCRQTHADMRAGLTDTSSMHMLACAHGMRRCEDREQENRLGSWDESR